MTDPDITLARSWANQLPRHLLEQLPTALRAGVAAVGALRTGSHGPASQAILEAAYSAALAGDGPYLAGLLDGYRAAREDQPTVVPVWTGPDPAAGAGSRLTLAVIAGLVDEAMAEILLVSYATAPSLEVRDALLRATDRGVAVTALLERNADNPKFFGHPDPLHGIPHTMLNWASGARDPGASMHAKILVVDRTSALIGSANFTGYGVERNLECGVLIRGGTIAESLVRHITAAITSTH